MKKNTLLESIKRIHQIIGIKPNILIESEINEANPVASEGAKLLAKLFTNLEKSLVVGGTSYTKAQVKTIIRKAGVGVLTADEKAVMQALSKELILADKLLIKKLTSEIFGEWSKLTNRQLKTKYYSEVKAGLKELLPETEVNKIINGVDAKITPKKPSGGQPTPQKTDPAKFSVPGSLETALNDVDLVDEGAVMARLKNLFPEAPSSKIQEMASNLKKANLLTQEEFNIAYSEAVKGYEPKYKKLLETPSVMARAKAIYVGLSKWEKRIFWIITFPLGYGLLKTIGVPVDRATGKLYDMWKEFFGDQLNGLLNSVKSSSGGSSNNSGGLGSEDY